MIDVVVATPEDWARVRQVRLAALADAPDAFWTVLADEQDRPETWWRQRLADPQRITVLAVRDGVGVGLAGAGPHDDPGSAVLYAVWAAPVVRGSGVADRMVAAVIAWARAQGYRRLRLDVGDDNARAIGFYRRTGFAPTGVRNAFPAPRDHLTEHEMALEL